MNKNLTEKLQLDFADYLTNDLGQSLYFECNDGWEPLIRETMMQLKKHNCNIKFQQIKEKFGSIRMYYYSEDEYSIFERNYYKIMRLINKTCHIISKPFYKMKLYSICNLFWNIYQNVEKFIGLRIFRFKSHITEHIINNATKKSETICETCGNPANIECIDRWYICICSNCLKQLNNKKRM